MEGGFKGGMPNRAIKMYRSRFYTKKQYQEPTVCPEQCCHFDLTEELKRIALYEEHELAKQKGVNNPSTQAINVRRDYVGSLSQNGLFAYVESLGLYIKTTSYYNPDRFNDDGWDYIIRDLKCDIKGRYIGVDQLGNPRTIVRKFTPFWVNVKQHKQKEGKIDYYTFVLVDPEQNLIHIPGIISYYDMERIGELRDGQWPSYNVRAHQLFPFRNHIFAT